MALRGPDGTEFARGLTNYGHEDLRKIKGLRTSQIAAVLGALPLRGSHSPRQHGGYRGEYGGGTRRLLTSVRTYIVRLSGSTEDGPLGDARRTLEPQMTLGKLTLTMEPFDNLTERQQAVYEFIRDKIRSRGYGPTVREIGRQFGINSPNGVVCHLKALEKKGLITREPNMSRAIQLAAEPIEDRSLPLAGRIAAGVLHEAIEQNERVDFDDDVRSGRQGPLRAGGPRRSMIEDQIADGDYVVVRQQKTAQGPDRRGHHRRGRGHAEALVPREEPHPPGAGQFDHEADLRPRRPGAGHRRRRGAEGGVDSMRNRKRDAIRLRFRNKGFAP